MGLFDCEPLRNKQARVKRIRDALNAVVSSTFVDRPAAKRMRERVLVDPSDATLDEAERYLRTKR